MNILNSLNKLQELASKNPALKQKLIETENKKEPLEEFCKIATDNNCPINIGELLALNETMWNNMLKSSNGGATFPMEEWSDAYEQFISSLKF